MRILWVENEVEWAEAYEMAIIDELREKGITCEIDFRSTGNQALDALQDEELKYDVLLLDVWLVAGVTCKYKHHGIDETPQLEMGKWILTYARANKIDLPPVIVVSGVLTVETINELRKFTKNELILNKPPDLDELLDRIRDAAGEAAK